MTYRELCNRLHAVYDLGEARAIVRLVLGERFGLSMADILCDKVTELSSDDRTELEKIMRRLLDGEPVQYVLGEAEFCGRKFRVAPGVLIPRPETEELCRWMIEERGARSEERDAILDIGTGSGCIAVTLAAEMPRAQVSAWDISAEALKIARENAERNGVEVTFEQVDALNPHPSSLIPPPSSLIPHPSSLNYLVSNPPYVCESEKTAMKPQVFEHEPSLALFVPDDDPLRFYRAIADFAMQSLKSDGWLYFEANPLYINELRAMLSEKGFDNIEEKCDQFGKKRMIRAKKSKKKYGKG